MREAQPVADTQKRTPCNLVMKGAIVSGVVYPSVITRLKDYHDFRNIGGTSSGAIAAAGAAAAEYRRQKAIRDHDIDHMNVGFARLEQLSDDLSKKGFLFSLFQPKPETKPLLDILSPLLALLQQSKPAPDAPPLLPIVRMIQRMWSSVPESMLRFISDVLRQWEDDYDALVQGKRQGSFWGGTVGAILGVLVAFAVTGGVALWGPDRLVLVIVLLSGLLLFGGGMAWLGEWLGTWLVGLTLAVAGLSGILTNKLPENFFGICIGHADDTQSSGSQQENLTDWLQRITSEMTGLPKDKPFTFGHLHEYGIRLRMVTSNLSHGRPYVMPEGLANFIWNEDEFKKFFPKEIVEHLKAYEDPLPNITLLPGSGYHFFPKVEDLPVLVAVRLSISFPLLLSAVPLRTIDNAGMAVGVPVTRTIGDDHLQKNWFSDGGISSNLPIQFFDEWLPTYPTFGVNLTSLRRVQIDPTTLSILPRLQLANTSAPQQRPQQATQPSTSLDNNPQVYLPRARDPYTPEWVPLDSLFSFFNAILGTGLYHRELTQVALPSYRERVVQIRLTPDQDGLHLDIDPEAVKGLIKNGDLAGQLLTNKAQGFDFEQYQWMRLLVFRSQIENNLKSLAGTQDIQSYQQLLKTVQDRLKDDLNAFPFPQDEKWYEETANNLQKLLELCCKDWQFSAENANSFKQDGVVLQVVPEC